MLRPSAIADAAKAEAALAPLNSSPYREQRAQPEATMTTEQTELTWSTWQYDANMIPMGAVTTQYGVITYAT
jgi:hypothetical protein